MQKVEICGVDTSGLPKLSAKENEELMRKKDITIVEEVHITKLGLMAVSV